MNDTLKILEMLDKINQLYPDKKELSKKTGISIWKLTMILDKKLCPTESEFARLALSTSKEMQVLPSAEEDESRDVRLSQYIQECIKDQKCSYTELAKKINVNPMILQNMLRNGGIYLSQREIHEFSNEVGVSDYSLLDSNSNAEAMGQKIRGYRAVNGMTVDKLSEISGVAPGRLDLFDAGYYVPDKAEQRKIAKAFNTSVGVLNNTSVPTFDIEKYPDFGARLKTAREAFKLTTKELGNFVNIGNNMVVNFENGKDVPTTPRVIDSLNKLFCCDFGIDVSEETNEICTENPKAKEKKVIATKTFEQPLSDNVYWMQNMESEEEKELGKTIGHKIRKLRTERNENVKDFASSLGCTYHIITQLEKGKQMPTPEFLEKIASHFDVSPGFLIGNECMLNTNSKEFKSSKQVPNNALDIEPITTPSSQEQTSETVSAPTSDTEKEHHTESISPLDKETLANLYDMLTDENKRILGNKLWDIFENQENRMPQYRRI